MSLVSEGKGRRSVRLVFTDPQSDTALVTVKNCNGIVFDGINIKLMKCGSFDEALKMIEIAKHYDLQIMIGCMVESSVGITAAAQLASEAVAVDLDGNLLIDNDPYKGVEVIEGRLHLSPNNNGMGLSLSKQEEGLL